MAIWKYKTEKGEIVSKLFEDEKDIPKGWKDSPQEAGKKKTTKKKQMALANKKSEELYNRKTGSSADSKTIDASKESILQDAFNNKEYIKAPLMLIRLDAIGRFKLFAESI